MAVRRVQTVLSGSVIFIAAACGRGQVVFQPLGSFVGGEGSVVSGVSRDGSVMVGSGWIYSGYIGSPTPAVWRASTGFVVGPHTQFQRLNGISADGRVILGQSLAFGSSYQACLFDQDLGLRLLGRLSGGVWSRAVSSTPDGAVVVGTSQAANAQNGVAFRWTANSGIVSIGTLPGHTSSSAVGISDDGLIVAGTSSADSTTHRAVRWTASGGIEDLGVLPGDDYSFGWALSRDGQTVLGSSHFIENGTSSGGRAFRWTAAGGIESIHMPFGSSSRPISMNAVGTMITGSGYLRNGNNAWIWTEETGMVDLNEYLPMLGADLGGRRLKRAFITGNDGRTLVGDSYNVNSTTPNHQGEEAWMAVLPAHLPPCKRIDTPVVVQTCPGIGRFDFTAQSYSDTTYSIEHRLPGGEWKNVPWIECGQGRIGYFLTGYTNLSIPFEAFFLCSGRTELEVRIVGLSRCTSGFSPSVRFVICRADMNCDQTLDVYDITAFLDRWFNGDVQADVLRTGEVAKPENLFQFLSDWFGGC